MPTKNTDNTAVRSDNSRYSIVKKTEKPAFEVGGGIACNGFAMPAIILDAKD